MITITEENIVECDVDAIVNAAHVYLSGGGGVDGAIHRAAGLELYEACAKIGHCDVGEAVITPGFNLKAKYIIHTVGPFYSKFHPEQNIQLLTNCYINSLNLAREYDIHTIAFPCISSGLYGYPIEESSEIAFTTVKQWLEENGDYDMEVRLVCYTEKEYDAYAEVVEKHNEDGEESSEEEIEEVEEDNETEENEDIIEEDEIETDDEILEEDDENSDNELDEEEYEDEEILEDEEDADEELEEDEEEIEEVEEDDSEEDSEEDEEDLESSEKEE